MTSREGLCLQFAVPGCNSSSKLRQVGGAQLLSYAQDSEDICRDITAACVCWPWDDSLTLRNVPPGTHRLFLRDLGQVVMSSSVRLLLFDVFAPNKLACPLGAFCHFGSVFWKVAANRRACFAYCCNASDFCMTLLTQCHAICVTCALHHSHITPFIQCTAALCARFSMR